MYGLPTLGVLLAALTSVTCANLNYLSPSDNHPQYAIPQSRLSKRSFADGPIRFTHGVASGDPYASSVILWTRAVPVSVNADSHSYSASSPSACVAWQISETSDFRDIVDSGTTETSGEVDYTVKVEAKNLKPLTYYHYRFLSCNYVDVSDIGRTKTLPAEDGDVPGGIRFAVYSCANFADGFFNAYGMSARKDSVDYVLHLGDYIYEMPLPTTFKTRIPRPFKETIQLRDYRLRHATARTDEDLRLSHQMLPWIAVWDDHEVANDGYTTGLASPLWMYLEWTSWQQRMENGLRAYFEWMPLRQVSATDNLRIWRQFRFGNLADLIMLDTRYYARDEPTEDPNLIYSPKRSILGPVQESWLNATLAESAERNTTWTLLGQQIQFSNINETSIPWSKDTPLYYDGWTGYRASRNRLLEKMQEVGTANPVVLTGDYHTLWTSELVWDDEHSYDPHSGNGSLGIELAGTSVTSSNGYGGGLSYEESTQISKQLTEDNSFLKWAEGYYRGYFELELNYEGLKASYFSVLDVTVRNEKEKLAAVWESQAGSKKFNRPLPSVSEGAVQKLVVQS